MAGELQTFVMGGFLMLAFSLMAANFVSVAASEGGYGEVNFPLANQTDAYLNQSEQFKNEFMQSVQEVQNAPPELSLAEEGIFGSSVILKALTFTTTSLTLVLNVITAGFEFVVGPLGIPGWAVAIGISAIVVMFAFALMNAVLRYDS